MVTKAFILSHGREFCIGTFTNVSAARVREICRNTALHRGYPVRIQWANPEWADSIISHRSEDTLEVRRIIRNTEDAIESLERTLTSTTNKKKRQQFKSKIRRHRSELRRLRRKEEALSKG